ncbi:MAG TPA: hypothetical protein VMT00_14705 [Thermoanaerobaculia bacterium]|nr:hypothetical protein [Thermoanaerobaculia bacterium]
MRNKARISLAFVFAVLIVLSSIAAPEANARIGGTFYRDAASAPVGPVVSPFARFVEDAKLVVSLCGDLSMPIP